jgi:hypothetical protein
VCGHKAEHHADVWIENARPRPGGGSAVWWECRVIGCECERFEPAGAGDHHFQV